MSSMCSFCIHEKTKNSKYCNECKCSGFQSKCCGNCNKWKPDKSLEVKFGTCEINFEKEEMIDKEDMCWPTILKRDCYCSWGWEPKE